MELKEMLLDIKDEMEKDVLKSEELKSEELDKDVLKATKSQTKTEETSTEETSMGKINPEIEAIWKPKKKSKICAVCGNEFEYAGESPGSWSLRKYCSKRCQKAAQKTQKAMRAVAEYDEKEAGMNDDFLINKKVEKNSHGAGKSLAEDHWSYIKSLLEKHGEEPKTIELVEFHYITAFEHGYKHAVEELS